MGKKSTWQLVAETENYRVFSSEDSYAYHYRNDYGRWRKGWFDQEHHLACFWLELVEEMVKLKKRGGGYVTFPNEWPNVWESVNE